MEDLPKEHAADAALKYVEPDMCIGLGTGRTADIFIHKLADLRTREHLSISCIPTSLRTEQLARSLGLHIVDFEDDAAESIDLAVDGADIVSSDFKLIKGLGGALTREKIVAYRSKKFIVMVEESKMRKALEGTVPIEVLPFAAHAVLREIRTLSKTVAIRMAPSGLPFKTDNNNYIIDAPMHRIKNPAKLEAAINNMPGVLENGIFTRADIVLVGSERGCRIVRNPHPQRFAYLKSLKE